MGLFNLFGTYSQKELKKINPLVDAIEALEESYRTLTDEQLRGKTAEFRARLAQGETLDDLLPEAFATVREAADRVLGMRHFRCQLQGGIVLYQGRISEMRTGEGKTLVATLPSYLAALEGKGVHVVTVNDYLARRDSEWMGKIHTFLGLTVGLITHEMEPADRRKAYAADITYATNNEIGFDYLRDNMIRYRIKEGDPTPYLPPKVQRDLHYAIVDEVDSILIDEARTPLRDRRQDRRSPRRLRLRGGGEEQDRVSDPPRSGKGAELFRHRELFRYGERADPALRKPIPARLRHHGAGRGLRGQGGRDHHRGRIHGTTHVRKTLLQRSAPSH